MERLRGGAKYRWSYKRIRSYAFKLADKFGIYQVYSNLPENLEVCRARFLKNNEPPKSIDDLGPPKSEDTPRYGRCSQPNSPVCYCSLYEDTALTEINAELGKQYVLSTFSLPQNIVLIPVGELDYYRRTGETYLGSATPESEKPYKEALEENDWILAALVDAFLSDEFIMPATNNTDYKITSAFSDVLLNGDLKPSNPIDGIIYPSVAFRHGLNFAIQPEAYRSKMRLVEAKTHIVEITEVLGYGIFEYKKVATIKSVNPEGLIVWEMFK